MKKISFNDAEIDAFAPSEKVGIVASVNPEGKLHMTLITSIMASGPKKMTLGQFCTGRSKWHIQENNKLAFLIMTMDRNLWRGKARWTHKRFDGPEYAQYNEQPMFRYNAYLGINTVHYLDLIETSEKEALPLAKIIPAVLLTKLVKGSTRTKSNDRILKPFAEDLFNSLTSLKFLSFLDDDGFPVIVPVIQCQAADSRRIVFSTIAYQDELKKIPKGAEVAIHCMNLNMQSVLVRGNFAGFQRQRLVQTGTVDIDWVYNSMPPVHDQIYPPVDLQPVLEFN